ncbi:nucleoside 2-deoxyribosyltransferase [Dyella solisilvae]|uniref:Nucleoside 2-deoxyribosyltransferase n=1 Tax=Dyella solisilvae TaxID=1920168 RepID=A0A370K9T5_9GAMM|nr:nucleoside 2-deoxyribosyltransferase [Dyella solisilvae]RDI98790.1 nucleoside 2-deoxyribosyltransferase [Dyella solisilvae]
MPSIKAYMAGPDVFLQNARERADEVRALCRQYGVVALLPADNDGEAAETQAPSDEALSLQIFRKNVALIDRADLVIANLEPFRGPSADVGTVWEIGYAFAQGKKIFAYSSAISHYLSRVSPKQSLQAKGWVDEEGMLIENFGLFDNLMIHHSLDGVFPSLQALLLSKAVQALLGHTVQQSGWAG